MLALPGGGESRILPPTHRWPGVGLPCHHRSLWMPFWPTRMWLRRMTAEQCAKASAGGRQTAHAGRRCPMWTGVCMHGIAGRGGHHLCTAFRHRAEWRPSSVSKQHPHGFLWFNAVFSAELLTLSHQNMPWAGLAVAPAVIWLQGLGCTV